MASIGKASLHIIPCRYNTLTCSIAGKLSGCAARLHVLRVQLSSRVVRRGVEPIALPQCRLASHILTLYFVLYFTEPIDQSITNSTHTKLTRLIFLESANGHLATCQQFIGLFRKAARTIFQVCKEPKAASVLYTSIT